ncbi:hypothetical protein L873DRAFT_1820002 [Choiromyces venosus 120613-1]|uniref:Uncharacterized protein n=1 Tax=Choiromyces venosus 120613-1 TaxID=1336337 RepID=A0A3N4J1X5_9PEZI|nr:hypothetical protein L873DRAFT_1820002 [Choiromyces venosus 120613-1]
MIHDPKYGPCGSTARHPPQRNPTQARHGIPPAKELRALALKVVLLTTHCLAVPVTEACRDLADIIGARGSGGRVADVGCLRGYVALSEFRHEGEVDWFGGRIVEDSERSNVFGGVPGLLHLWEGEGKAGERARPARGRTRRTSFGMNILFVLFLVVVCFVFVLRMLLE